jgi:hypothetical protein
MKNFKKFVSALLVLAAASCFAAAAFADIEGRYKLEGDKSDAFMTVEASENSYYFVKFEIGGGVGFFGGGALEEDGVITVHHEYDGDHSETITVEFAGETAAVSTDDAFKKSVFCENGAVYDGEYTRMDNLLDKMSGADWRTLNIFFSNFCESHLNEFDAGDYDDRTLIAFAVSHNVINNPKLFKDDSPEGPYYIGKDNVNVTIEKYFGIKGVKPQSAEDRFVIYKNGRYYWDDVMEGAPWFAGGQAVELYDNGDGTLSAVVEWYEDNEVFVNNVDKFDVKDFYAPKKSWKGNTANYYELSRRCTAKIAPHSYGGKKTYKLLKWGSEGNG